MKKLLSLILCFIMVISIFNGVTVSATTEAEKTNGASVLDGKKVMFIGNSYTYYGKTVIEKSQKYLTQAERDNDKGFFYQICKNNGAEVDVTNWTFGAHDTNDLFVECSANRGCDGVDHKSYIVDRDYDYVVIQQGGGLSSDPDIVGRLQLVMDFFKEANPDTKFIFLVQQQAYVSSYAWLPYIDDLEEMGVTVVNWGQVVYNIMRNYLEVPGAKESYNQNSFVVCQSATDGYHPNMLTGYITSLMTYCAITGETAVGQDYSFCNDTTVNSAFDFDKFAAKYYTYDGATTNFPEIFESASDMKGIQQIIDETLAENVPYFKTNLNTTEPYTGENVLSVEVEVSEGTPSYQWYKDGVAVEGATSSSYTATEPATYKVEVTNTLNGVPYKMTSNECLVDYAMEKPVVSIENGTSIEIAKGDAVTLRAKATSSDGGTLTYKWYKDGKAISSVSTYDIYTAKSEGTYKVVVTNSGDKNPATASAEIVVTVNEKSENIALNKTYEWVDTTIFNSSYPDTDMKEMTDGNIPESVSYTNSGLTTANSGKSLSMIIDLGDGCQFNAVKLAYASSYSAGLKMAGRMTAEYSNDKKTWTPMGTWTNSNIAQKGIMVAEVRSATPISARYVRITDSGSSNTGLHFMSEALVIGSVDPKAALDGKKVIFVGDSGIYNGKAVLEKASTALTQEERTGDEGLLYQLCKENGIDVSVTNWAFDGHNLSDLFEECTAGCEVDHKSYLTDKNYDYVVIQESDDADLLAKVDTVMSFFKGGNAKTKFILLVQPKAHTDAYEWLADLAELEEMGVEVVDWGNLVYGVMNNMLTVSGTESYNKNSFITSQGEDDHKPNILSGYLMSLMTYSAITGESAVGKSYDFCQDFDFDAYCNEYYTDGATTNFPEIFASAEDMNSLQELADLTLDGVIPVITRDLGAEATFSERTIISVEAQAKKGTLSYHWYKDGIIIDGATESSYTVDEPGEYKVDVINKYNDVKYTMVSKTCALVQTFESDHLLKGVAPSDYTVNGWGFDGTKDVSILTDGVLHTDNKSYKKNITFSNFPASFEYDKELTFREIDIVAHNPSDLDVYGIGALSVEGYVDGEWYMLASVTGIAPETAGRTYTLTSDEDITVEKLRVNINGLAASGGTWGGVSISEIQVFTDVKATAPDGTLKLNTAKMEVPTVTITNGSTLELAKGDIVTLRASASVSDGGTLSYQWYKDDVKLTSVSTYNLYSILSSDPAGTYKVVVTNSGDNTATSASAEIVVTSSDTANNIALNKTYEWVDTSGINTNYPDTDNKELTNGKMPYSVSYANSGYIGSRKGYDLPIIIDLGESTSFDAVKAVYMSTYSSGLRMAGKLTAEYSNDKENWTPFGEWTNDKIALKGILVAEIESETPVTARYVRVTDVGSANAGMHFMSEVMVFAPKVVETPSYNVSGTVKAYGDTTAPAKIELIADGEVVDTVIATGTYTIEGVEDGNYTLKVSKSKHATKEYKITVDGADVTQNAEIWLYGDVTGDGIVNATDVMQLNRRIANLTSVFNQTANADYRIKVANITAITGADTIINATDVMQVNRRIANLSSIFDRIA